MCVCVFVCVFLRVFVRTSDSRERECVHPHSCMCMCITALRLLILTGMIKLAVLLLIISYTDSQLTTSNAAINGTVFAGWTASTWSLAVL